jgi:hypothetical protein
VLIIWLLVNVLYTVTQPLVVISLSVVRLYYVTQQVKVILLLEIIAYIITLVYMFLHTYLMLVLII